MVRHAELGRCKDWIEAALAKGEGTHDFWDIVDGVYSGHMQLWPRAKGCLVTEVVVYPKRKILNVFLGAGELDELADMHQDIIKWAKDSGCDGASINGRRGWVRAFQEHGWKEIQTTVGLDF
jgi:hypothetical protein